MGHSWVLRSWQSLGCWGQCTQGLLGPIGLFPEVEHVWSWFPALAMTCKAPVHREQEEDKTLHVLIVSNRLGEKPESTAFLNNTHWG